MCSSAPWRPPSRSPGRGRRILVGGAGERKTLRLVARYADARNLFDIPDGGATVRRKLDVLARHCEELGRPVRGDREDGEHAARAGEPAEAFAERSAVRDL